MLKQEKNKVNTKVLKNCLALLRLIPALAEMSFEADLFAKDQKQAQGPSEEKTSENRQKATEQISLEESKEALKTEKTKSWQKSKISILSFRLLADGL